MSKRTENKMEIEYKFRINDPTELFRKIDGKPRILYIKDEVYGPGLGVSPKVRKRKIVKQDGTVEIRYEKTEEQDGDIKTVKEEDAKYIPEEFDLENSYEKIRYFFDKEQYEIAIDFYPIGIFCEIEGPKKVIKKVAKNLGFNLEETLKENIDTIYYNNKDYNSLYHWGFGKL